MNAIELLKKDHQKVAGLFKRYESIGDDASSEKEGLFQMIKRELDVHARIEEEIFYPAAKQVPVEEAKELVAEAGEEHKQIKTLLAELDGMDADDEQFDAKMKVLTGDVEHHVEEEQDELFPKVQRALGNDRLEDLGRQLAARKRSLVAERGGEEDKEETEAAGPAARSSPRVRRATVPRSSAGSSRRAGRFGSGSDHDGDDDSTSKERGSRSGARDGANMASGGSSSDARDDTIGGASRSGAQGGANMASGGSSSDARDDIMGGGSGSGSTGGRSRSGSRSRSSSGNRSGGRSRGGSRASPRGGSGSSSRGRSRSTSSGRSRSRSGSRGGSRGRSTSGARSRSVGSRGRGRGR